MRFNFFKNLNAILLKEPQSNLAAQMQISYLCSMLMWVNNVKNQFFSNHRHYISFIKV